MEETKRNPVQSSVWGVGRGVCVHAMIYPLEVIKIRQQRAEKATYAFQVVRELFFNEGPASFYRGLSAQLVKTSIKQVWAWPVITEAPLVFKKHGFNELSQMALTGLSIAAIDALFTTPLEKAKVFSASNGKKFSLEKGFFKKGWLGGFSHFGKLSINWVTFLTAQKALREKIRKEPGEILPFTKVALAGSLTALIVAVVGAPFDYLSTHALSKRGGAGQVLLNKRPSFQLYRGLPLSALSLVIHNIASAFVIEKLETSK